MALRKKIAVGLSFAGLVLAGIVAPSRSIPPHEPASLPAALAASAAAPALVSIPSANINAAVVPVGTDADGAMAVPTVTNTVGWYDGGTVPGAPGSAVFAAHVYLAFKPLKKMAVGASIYVTDANGVKTRFVVTSIRTYPYRKVPAQTLFAQDDGLAHLNLITCSGTWLPAENTYDHRLVVYARRAS